MSFKQYIQDKFETLIYGYEKEKSMNGRLYNTIIQSYTLATATQEKKNELTYKMQDAVKPWVKVLRTNRQKEKFIADNMPIDDNTYFEEKLSKIMLIDTCELIEYLLLKTNFIIQCIKYKDRFESLGKEAFEKQNMKKANNAFRYKYDEINNMCNYVDIDEVINSTNELKKSKNIFKYIFFLRNCIIHSGGIAQKYLIEHQESIRNELEELRLPLLAEDDNIILSTSEINTMIAELRKFSELIPVALYNKVEEYLNDDTKSKFMQYIDDICFE